MNNQYPEYTCPTCGNKFTVTEHPERVRTYCSRKCSKVGNLNPNWKGKVAKFGSEHPGWKGDKVGIDALHVYIRRRLPKPQKCPICRKSPPYDLANISNEYKREVSDWEWLCRKCHMEKDGRLDKLIENGNKATERRKSN